MNKVVLRLQIVRSGKDTISMASQKLEAPGLFWSDPSWQVLHAGIVLELLMIAEFLPC